MTLTRNLNIPAHFEKGGGGGLFVVFRLDNMIRFLPDIENSHEQTQLVIVIYTQPKVSSRLKLFDITQ